jgi:hypothetical protein
MFYNTLLSEWQRQSQSLPVGISYFPLSAKAARVNQMTPKLFY